MYLHHIHLITNRRAHAAKSDFHERNLENTLVRCVCTSCTVNLKIYIIHQFLHTDNFLLLFNLVQCFCLLTDNFMEFEQTSVIIK